MRACLRQRKSSVVRPRACRPFASTRCAIRPLGNGVAVGKGKGGRAGMGQARVLGAEGSHVGCRCKLGGATIAVCIQLEAGYVAVATPKWVFEIQSRRVRAEMTA